MGGDLLDHKARLEDAEGTEKEMPFHVFVVDDEKNISDTMAAILRASGFVATPFTNPLEAWNCACTQAIDLLLSDVRMPELSGIDLAIRIKERQPGCRIVLFSGQAGTADLLEEARQRGHDFQIISKPIHPLDLIARIRSLL